MLQDPTFNLILRIGNREGRDRLGIFEGESGWDCCIAYGWFNNPLADYNGDGRLDIAKTNFSGDLPSLYRNDDGGFFTDVSAQSGLGANHLLGWGIAFVDLDDDGWKDLVIANGHVYPEVDRAPVGDRYHQKTLVYRNLGNGKFADITRQAGPALEALRTGARPGSWRLGWGWPA